MTFLWLVGGFTCVFVFVVDIEGGTASPMSLVKTFDSFLAVHEGFCNLKQLSDFGFASCISRASPHITSTGVSGTFSYLAPEYFLHGKVTDKVDVFACGVVLLELLSGKLPINIENPKCHSIFDK